MAAVTAEAAEAITGAGATNAVPTNEATSPTSGLLSVYARPERGGPVEISWNGMKCGDGASIPFLGGQPRGTRARWSAPVSHQHVRVRQRQAGAVPIYLGRPPARFIPPCYTCPMRKRLKKKRRACGLCKPHKRAISNRWKRKDLDLLERAESEIRLRNLDA
jgi:hypothetical protein